MSRSRLKMAKRRPPSLTAGSKTYKLEVIFILALLLGAGAFYIDRHPITFGSGDQDRAVGTERAGTEIGDVLLILPSVPRVGDSFDELDFSASWHNILSQEFGAYRTVKLGDFSHAALQDASLIVVPTAVSRQVTAQQVVTMESYINGGGRVLVEMPTANWESLVALPVDSTEIRPTRRITAFDGALVRGDLRDDVIQTPFRTVMGPIQAASARNIDGLEILLEVDGLPGLTRRGHGRGEVLTLYFDLARAITAIQQGMPASDWDITRPSATLPAGLTRTSCLVGDGRLRESPVPSADLLEQNILNAVTTGRPTPRVWRFPGTHSGAFVMTHSGIPNAHAGRFMTSWETSSGVTSTVFRHSRDLSDLPERLQSASGALLVPLESSHAPHDDWGIFGFNPFRTELGFQGQLEAISALSNNTPDLTVTRLAEGLWSPEYGQTFQELTSLGVDIDSSYGPTFEPTELDAVNGYTFGTGLPFSPLDRNGLLLDILEIPYVLHDGLSFDTAWSSQLIDEAGRAYNELIVAEWRSGTMFSDPRAEIVMAWKDSFSQAAIRGLWVTDLVSFGRFWRTRSELRIRSTFNASERRLEMTAEVPEGFLLLDESVRPSIAFEAFFDGRPIERVTRNGQDIPFAELGRSADGVFHIFAPDQGRHQIEVSYQGPIEVPSEGGEPGF